MSNPTLSFSEQRQRNQARQAAFDVQNQLEKISLDTIWCGDHTQLQIVTYCSNSALTKVRVSYRIIRTNGGVDNVDVYVTITTDRVVNVNVLEIGKGWLQSVSVIYPTSSSKRGDCWSSAALIDRESARQYLALCFGYITAQESINYPPGDKESFISGRGNIRSITGTDPAAGSEILETVPTNAVWRLLSIAFDLVTDATATTRYSGLEITDGTDTLNISYSSVAHNASTTKSYYRAKGYIDATSRNTLTFVPFPKLPLLLGGYTVGTITQSLQAGDDFGAPVYVVEEWLQE